MVIFATWRNKLLTLIRINMNKRRLFKNDYISFSNLTLRSVYNVRQLQLICSGLLLLFKSSVITLVPKDVGSYERDGHMQHIAYVLFYIQLTYETKYWG